jgi:hypothetical protein
MNLRKTPGAIEALLLHGEANAIPIAQLVELAGLQSQRQLRLVIEQERRNGSLILSTVRGRGGYFLPSCDPIQRQAELSAFIHTVHVRAVNSQKMLRAARQALRECESQVSL